MVPVIWTVRYSILVRQNLWNITKNVSFDDYKTALFQNKRLIERHWLFANVTLPSLAVQEGIDCGKTHVQVVASSEIPDEHKRVLEQEVDKFPWLSLVYHSVEDGPVPFREYLSKALNLTGVSEGDIYVHARIDDDDAVSKDFTSSLRKFAFEETVGFAISFESGIVGSFCSKNNVFLGIYEYSDNLIALGLSVVGKVSQREPSHDIFGLGAHKKISDKYPVIVKRGQPHFIRTSYAGQDTGGAIGFIRSYPIADPQRVIKYINVPIEILPDIKKSTSQLKIERLRAFIRYLWNQGKRSLSPIRLITLNVRK